MMLCALRMLPFSQAAIKLQLHGGALRRGVKGAIADFVCSHCPLVASAEANPLLAGKTSYGWKDQQVGRAHLARHCIDVG